jgi:IclR family KDG regulon transcriptional repressor
MNHIMDLLKHKKTSYTVQALERALNILDCFTFQKREMRLSELVQETGLNKTTAKRLIANLAARGYLQQDPKSKHYQLGLRLFELGGIVFSSFSLRKAAAYPMSHLENSTGATVLLGAIMEDQLVYMDKREGKGMIRISSDIGWRRPLHYGMLGMVLMAYLSVEEINEILEKDPLGAHTPHSITDEYDFKHRLGEIRKDGYVIEREEAVEGIVGIAAPIRDYSRRVVAALGVALPVGQLNEEEGVKTIVDLVKNTTDAISSDLGYLKI